MKMFMWAARIMWREYRSHTIAIFVICLILGVCEAIYPIVWQKLLDNTAWNYGLVTFYVVLMCSFTLPFSLPKERLIIRYRRDNSRIIFNHLLTLDDYGSKKKSTVRSSEIKNGLEAGGKILSMFLEGSILIKMPVALWALYYVACRSSGAFFALVAFVGIFVFLSSWFGKRVGEVSEQTNELKNENSSYLREMISLLVTVRIHQTEKVEKERYANKAERVYGLEKKMGWLSSFSWFQEQFSWHLPSFIALAYFLPKYYAKAMTLGELIALCIFCGMVVAPIGYLGKIYQDLKQEEAKLQPVLDILKEKPQVLEDPEAIAVGSLRQGINLQDVTFAHRNSDRKDLALRGVSLFIPAGQKVAVIGPSGCGKTTMAKVIARIFDPQEGTISFDGTDLRQISLASLHRQIYLVTQEMLLFSGTVRENVAYGTDASDEEIGVACRSANADFVFDELEKGLDTDVGEMGNDLSGGQRQRIVLARIFLRNPSVVILDEPASALDPWMEKEVCSAIDDFLSMNGDTTVIVISHRMHTIRRADKIVVMEDGRITDIGKHDELLNRCDLYKQFCEV